MYDPFFDERGDANEGRDPFDAAALDEEGADENKAFDSLGLFDSLVPVPNEKEEAAESVVAVADPKLNPLEGAFAFFADGGAPNEGFGADSATAGAGAPKEKAGFAGVAPAKEMFANGFAVVGVPSSRWALLMPVNRPIGGAMGVDPAPPALLLKYSQRVPSLNDCV